MKTKKIKILIADDHAVVRAGLKHLIETESDFTVCAEAKDGAEALELFSKLHPDIAIVDIGMPGMNGLELIKNLKNRSAQFPILVVSMYDESVYAERVLHAGAKGYLMKKESAEKIIDALRKILSGKVYLSATMSEKILSRMSNAKSAQSSAVDLLSDRELEVFQMIGRGCKSAQIADELSIGVKTVESYREQIKLKLQIDRSAELTQYAIGWVHRQQ